MVDQRSLIDWSRGVAAVIVAAGHLRNHMLPDYRLVPEPHFWFKAVAFVAGFGSSAVIVFFVISGWLVGGALIKNIQKPSVLANYTLDRLTRLWTVLVPMFLMQAIIAAVLYRFYGLSSSHPTDPATLLGNLFGLQTLLYPQFASNYPLWSLANETVYYVMFPSYLAWQRAFAALTLALYAALIAQNSLWILAYSLMWLAGAFARDVKLGLRWALLFGASFICVTFVCRIYRIDSNFFADFAIALLFAATLSSLATANEVDPQRLFARLGQFLASFSFTLYVVHVPVIRVIEFTWPDVRAMSDPQAIGGLSLYMVQLAIILVCSYAFFSVTERHTASVRAFVKRQLWPASFEKCLG